MNIYLKMQLVYFFEGLDYVDGLVPSKSMVRKQGKWYIETHLFMNVDSKKAKKIVFGK